MEKIISQIEKIREIKNQNKLVIFVGAGVSKNSGVCSWWELVRDIAIKIRYDDICEKCATKYEHNSECGDGCEFCSSNSKCYWKYNFSADDFLKIPQYFFDTKGKSEYYDFLKNKFCKTYTPNAIDELIIELNPEHIITTNYDHLIEDVADPSISKYTIIKNDKNLLEQNGRRYIIKMHGDIDEVEDLVLKEDDYLKYSQNHIIIETYIKSLLIDKTFLFIGYSLNDNNLNLIMSYIDYFVKNKEVERRSPHYLVVNSILKQEREILYWKNKGVELINLSDLNADMKCNTKCSSLESEQGQSLFTFLKYLHDYKLPYYNNKQIALEKSLVNNLKQCEAFNFVSYNDLLKVCCFSSQVTVINSSLNFFNEDEYKLLKSIFQAKTNESTKIKRIFVKAGLYAIQCNGRHYDSYDIENYCYEEDSLFEMSLKNQYKEILDIIRENDNKLENAYYYSLIYQASDELTQIMKDIEEQIKKYDYHNLSIDQKVTIAIFEFNTISLRILNFNHDNKEQLRKLSDFLDSASHHSTTFDTIKKMFGDNGNVLNKLNDCLNNHEKYYMEKSTITKSGGTIYGDLFDLQSIAYDYYKFYKKNHLMLDWFNNVEKICEPYIKAILCTYYPDEYQFSNNVMGKTQVKPYPINHIDIDMIVKHTSFKNFNNWLSYYKVFKIEIDSSIDIVEIFENFCISMRSFWNSHLNEHLQIFSKLISLVELTSEQKHRILNAFIKLVEPDKNKGINLLRNSLNSIWLYIEKHYDDGDNLYSALLKLLVNGQLVRNDIRNIFVSKYTYKQLITKLYVHADEDIYKVCVDMIDKNKLNIEKSYFTFVFHKILLKFDYNYWQKYIESTISDNNISEICTYIETGIITFNDKIKSHVDNMLIEYKKSKVPGTIYFPDHQKNAIEELLILLLTGRIPNLEDIDFLKQYTEDSDYLDFLFNPDSFRNCA